LEVANFII